MPNERAAVAQRMRARGYACIPYHPGTNRPMGNGWQKLDTSGTTQLLVQRPDLNIGFRMGVQPNGKRLLGLDDDGDLQEVELLLGQLPPTWTQRTPSGGCHVVFRVPPGIQFLNTAKVLVDGKRYELDVRCDGAALCLAPSVRPEGVYEVTDSRPIAALPERWVSALRYVAPPEPAPMSEHLVPSLERALAYCEKVEPAISGSGGHRVTFRVAVKAREFGLDLAGIMTVLRAFNLRCQPQWSEKEIRHKAQQAISRSHAQPGSKLVGRNLAGHHRKTDGDAVLRAQREMKQQPLR